MMAQKCKPDKTQWRHIYLRAEGVRLFEHDSVTVIPLHITAFKGGSLATVTGVAPKSEGEWEG